MLSIIGNRDPKLGWDTLSDIVKRLEEARRKHEWPQEALGKYQALGVIGAEYHELEKAVEKESPQRVKDELLDVIVTCIRMYNGEHIVEDER